MGKRSEGALANEKRIGKLMFKLLPTQILLAMIVVLNGIVSSLFASNCIDIKAMSAVGLYAPVLMLLGSINMMLVSGSTILCGEKIGRNEMEGMRAVFSLDMVVTFFIGLCFTAALFVCGRFGLVAFIARDPELRPVFSTYLIGQAIGVIPLLLGNQLSSFLSLENKIKRNFFSSVLYIICNLIFNYLFIQKFRMGVFGLALASSAGAWVYFLAQAQAFAQKNMQFKFSLKNVSIKDLLQILKVGYPGALSNGYQTIRGLIVNYLLATFIGAAGLSAFCAANSIMTLIWCIPLGMVAVSRMVMSVGIGDEDRLTVGDVMRVMFKKFTLVNLAITILIALCAKPLAYLYYKDVSSDVYMMTVWGFRLLPFCLCTGSIMQHFVCYAQASGKNLFVHLLSILDGFIFVSAFSVLLIKPMGMNSIYAANVLNGICTTLFIYIYSICCNRRFPLKVEDLMVMPDSFGVPESERLDFSVKSMDDVVLISHKTQEFCLERCVDERRAFVAGLSLEEMAGNVVDHGFNKDNKKHSAEVRVAHKEDSVILRVRDDCVSFDPFKRFESSDKDDVAKNVGLKIVYRMAKAVSWQSIFGMNVLTIKI
ncbi:MAG: ATP-binding protein [Treponema sp.]|nr:ATP-binding protein [Treponema sp.]